MFYKRGDVTSMLISYVYVIRSSRELPHVLPVLPLIDRC